MSVLVHRAGVGAIGVGMGRHPEGTRARSTAAGDYFPLPTGPATPQRGVRAPAEGLAARERHERAAPWWLGTHGGSGETTLAGAVAGSAAAGHAWPVPPDLSRPQDVVLVARTHLTGLRATQLAATQWASGSVPGVTLVGLVLLADAPGRLPRALRELADLVSGGVPRVWHLPWVEAWRLGDEPRPVPRELTRLIHDLDSLLPGRGA